MTEFHADTMPRAEGVHYPSKVMLEVMVEP